MYIVGQSCRWIVGRCEGAKPCYKVISKFLWSSLVTAGWWRKRRAVGQLWLVFAFPSTGVPGVLSGNSTMFCIAKWGFRSLECLIMEHHGISWNHARGYIADVAVIGDSGCPRVRCRAHPRCSLSESIRVELSSCELNFWCNFEWLSECNLIESQHEM